MFPVPPAAAAAVRILVDRVTPGPVVGGRAVLLGLVTAAGRLVSRVALGLVIGRGVLVSGMSPGLALSTGNVLVVILAHNLLPLFVGGDEFQGNRIEEVGGFLGLGHDGRYLD